MTDLSGLDSRLSSVEREILKAFDEVPDYRLREARLAINEARSLLTRYLEPEWFSEPIADEEDDCDCPLCAEGDDDLPTLGEIAEQMTAVAGGDQAPVVVDRLQFLTWAVALNRMTGVDYGNPPAAPYASCPCEFCQDTAHPDDDKFSRFFTYGVFGQ